MPLTLVSVAVSLWRAVVTGLPWPYVGGGVVLLLALRAIWRRETMHRSVVEREWRRRLEMEAYNRLEVTIPVQADPRGLAEQGKRICRLIAATSRFPRSAFYLRGESGAMQCVGSCGMDDLTLAALDEWGQRIVLEEDSETRRDREGRGRDAVRSFRVNLATKTQFDGMPTGECQRAMIVPLRMTRGRLVGVLAVCAGPLQRLEGEEELQAIVPIEGLASRLAAFVERSLLMQRLIELERLAAAGQIVATVARELTDPLAAVLGLAELMAESSAEARTQQDAEQIIVHGTKMQEILEGLRGFWRPAESPGYRVAKAAPAAAPGETP